MSVCASSRRTKCQNWQYPRAQPLPSFDRGGGGGAIFKKSPPLFHPFVGGSHLKFLFQILAACRPTISWFISTPEGEPSTSVLFSLMPALNTKTKGSPEKNGPKWKKVSRSLITFSHFAITVSNGGTIKFAFNEFNVCLPFGALQVKFNFQVKFYVRSDQKDQRWTREKQKIKNFNQLCLFFPVEWVLPNRFVGVCSFNIANSQTDTLTPN